MIEPQPVVSVIIPIYNVENYLSDALTSLISQSFHSFEALMIDDGSTDNSYIIAQKFVQKDSRFRLYQTSNYGQSHARNIGLKYAKGEFITFLDPDDTYSKIFIESLIEQFDSSTDIVASLFPKNNNSNRDECLKVTTDFFIAQMFSGVIGTVVWNKMFRRTVLNGVDFPVGQVHEEINFFYKLLPHLNDVKILSKTLYNYRVARIGNSNSTFNFKRLTSVDDRLIMLKYLKKHEMKKAFESCLIDTCVFLFNYVYMLKETKQIVDKRFLKKVRKYRRILLFNFYNFYFLIKHPHVLFLIIKL